MTGPPKEADPTAAKKALFPTDERRDCHNVVSVGSVLQTKQETQAQYDE
jgi:hypothetical protein